ncbi:unnamed protein product [Thelazia callipaeda]|uniref:Secreted protein n=1 Tax=Thelazia callipaeda TaxID=103827 RepID=A0A0N5DC98_THECL|nr:unnamed protein product [Thelazia callipaeda]
MYAWQTDVVEGTCLVIVMCMGGDEMREERRRTGCVWSGCLVHRNALPYFLVLPRQCFGLFFHIGKYAVFSSLYYYFYQVY